MFYLVNYLLCACMKLCTLINHYTHYGWGMDLLSDGAKPLPEPLADLWSVRPTGTWVTNEKKSSITVTSHDWHKVSDHWPPDCFFNNLFRLTTKKTANKALYHWAFVREGNPLVTSVFPSQMASDAESISKPWYHHDGRHFFPGLNEWNAWVPQVLQL